jgi:hypothetical protein
VLVMLSSAGKVLRDLVLPEVSNRHGVTIGPGCEILLTDRDRQEIRVPDAEDAR